MTKSRPRHRPAPPPESLLREYVRDVLLEQGLIDGIEQAAKFSGGTLGPGWGAARKQGPVAMKAVQGALLKVLEMTPEGQEAYQVLSTFSAARAEEIKKSLAAGEKLLLTLLRDHEDEIAPAGSSPEEMKRATGALLGDPRMKTPAGAALLVLAGDKISATDAYRALTGTGPVPDPQSLQDKLPNIITAHLAGKDPLQGNLAPSKETADNLKAEIKDLLAGARRTVNSQLSTVTKDMKLDPNTAAGRAMQGALRALPGAS